jgi:hypothetical protein
MLLIVPAEARETVIACALLSLPTLTVLKEGDVLNVAAVTVSTTVFVMLV